MTDDEVGDPLEAGLERLRDASRPELAQRLSVIDRCIAAWQAGPVEVALWQAGRREAHRLAGSLGMLGFTGGTEVARRLNDLFQGEQSPAAAGRAAELLAALHRELAGPPAPVPADPSAPVAAGLARPVRVLLADDDDTIAAAVRVALQLDGLELLRARDGEAAIRLAREQDVDLLLLDLEMPLLDGFEVCRTLRADPRLAAIPIIVMTAHSERGRIQAELAQGATDYLAKPFKVSDLRHRVRTLLASRPSELPTDSA
jgi:CheY-like chemotaxis protein